VKLQETLLALLDVFFKEKDSLKQETFGSSKKPESNVDVRRRFCDCAVLDMFAHQWQARHAENRISGCCNNAFPGGGYVMICLLEYFRLKLTIATQSTVILIQKNIIALLSRKSLVASQKIDLVGQN
jgi:hypothetical protein